MLSSSEPANLISTADEFRRAVARFGEVTDHEASYEETVQAFQLLERSERQFLQAFRQLDSDGVQQSLRDLDTTLATVRTSLNLRREDFSRRRALDLAASIDNLADQLDVETRDWLSHDRQTFSAQAVRDVQALADSAHELHEALHGSETQTQIQRRVVSVHDSWRRCYQHLVKCQTENRANLGRIASALTPALVELRTLTAE
jgi:hypothetical protein